MTTEEIIRPIITATYGDWSMSYALATDLASKIDAGSYEAGRREDMVQMTCWNWFSGGTTAEHVAEEIEQALQERTN
jgi:hypothetical protein